MSKVYSCSDHSKTWALPSLNQEKARGAPITNDPLVWLPSLACQSRFAFSPPLMYCRSTQHTLACRSQVHLTTSTHPKHPNQFNKSPRKHNIISNPFRNTTLASCYCRIIRLSQIHPCLQYEQEHHSHWCLSTPKLMVHLISETSSGEICQ